MVAAQGLGVALGPVRAVQMVPMQVVEAEAEVVVVANTVVPDMVADQARAQALVNIAKEYLQVLVDLLARAVMVAAVAEDKLEVIMDPAAVGMVVELAPALARLITTGTDQVLQMQMLMAMVMAKATVKMVGAVVAKVVDLGTVMHIPKISTDSKMEPNLCVSC